MMDKRGLLSRIDRAWGDFVNSYSELNDREITERGITGDWSIIDIIAHVTTWEEEALKYLPIIAEGNPTPRYSKMYGGINEFNAIMTDEKRKLQLKEALEEQGRVHDSLVKYIEGVPEAVLKEQPRFLRRVRADTYGHYSRHARAIKKWREK